MLVSKARWMMDGEGTWLCFRADSPRAAQEVIGEMEEGKRYELTLKQQRKRRSLDSNAYAWTLMDKLAERMGLPKEEIYRGMSATSAATARPSASRRRRRKPCGGSGGEKGWAG